MKVEVSYGTFSWTITEVERIDPINVYWQDLGSHTGRILVECYGNAWAAYWGSMGGPLQDFVRGLDGSYLTSCLMAGRKHTQREQQYLKRVADAVVEAAREYVPH